MGNNVTNLPPTTTTTTTTTTPNRYYNHFDLLENEPTPIIKPFLYLGGMYARKNPHVLEYLGITHVLNMAAEQHFETVHRNINVKHILADDYETYNIRQHFEEAFQFIEDALMKNGRILVHCAVGISRSPTIVIAYIMHRYGMSYQNAYQYVQSLRPIVNPNNSFKTQLQEFEYELLSLNSQQQQYSSHIVDNLNTSQGNITNFNMNGMNPINVKAGSKKNYAHHLMNDTVNVQQQQQFNYADQNLLYSNFNNGYYFDPVLASGMYHSLQQLNKQFNMLNFA
jgi:protein-tyrosine phosphatase